MSIIPLYKVRTITCANCGKTVTKRMPAGRKYCSGECSSTATKPSRKSGEDVTCEYCGIVFYLPANRLKAAKHFFCSLDHQIAWQGRNRHHFTCKTCGKDFTWSPSRIKQAKPTYCSLECRDKDPERSAMLRKMNVKQQTMKPNHAEQKGYAILEDIGVTFERQYLIGDKFAVDAYIPNARLIIQFDGDYWHSNPAKFSNLDARQKKRVQIDNSQNKYFEKCGYTVLRFWVSDIESRPHWVASQIASTLNLSNSLKT